MKVHLPLVLAALVLSAFAVLPARSRGRPATAPPTPALSEAAAVVAYWRAGGPQLWWQKDPELDRRLRERFIVVHEAAARGELARWRLTPEGSLALVILLDQFPRNAFRGTARMYATDALARETALAAVLAKQDAGISRELRLFLYLPFGHSEDLADQERSVELCRNLDPLDLQHAEQHRDIVRRFGRFPHRNPILGRMTTPAEQRFLDEGGFSG